MKHILCGLWLFYYLPWNRNIRGKKFYCLLLKMTVVLQTGALNCFVNAGMCQHDSFKICCTNKLKYFDLQYALDNDWCETVKC